MSLYTVHFFEYFENLNRVDSLVSFPLIWILDQEKEWSNKILHYFIIQNLFITFVEKDAVFDIFYVIVKTFISGKYERAFSSLQMFM